MCGRRGIEKSQTVAGRAACLTALTVSWALTGWALLCGCALSGCAPAPFSPHPSGTTGSTSPTGTAATGSGGRESLADQERQVAEHTDAQGRKWLGDVPYDVFFDDPLAVAAEGRTAAPTTTQTSPKAAVASADNSGTAPRNSMPPGGGEASTRMPSHSGGASPASSNGAAKPAGPATDWAALIDPDTLESEVKRIRTELTAGLQSVGKYNARYQEIAVSAATLAALAEIVIELPRSSSWKDHAASVRDLAANIHDSAKALGAQAYQATKNSSDQLMDVLDGNIPAGLPASEPTRDFSQVANRSALMKRMDRSFQRLKKGGTAQQLLKKDAGQALEDAAILAVLSRVISVGRYDSVDDPKYRGHATELTRSATDLATAARAGEAPAFAEALTRMQKRCDACHADFRF